MTNTIQYDSKTPFLFSPSLSLSLPKKSSLCLSFTPFFEKTLNPTSLQKKKKKLETVFYEWESASFWRKTKTLHICIRQSSLVNVLRVFEKIDDDVNDDKERRQKRMRGEEEETAPVRRRALFFKTHTHTHIYIDWCWCCVLLFPSMSLG